MAITVMIKKPQQEIEDQNMVKTNENERICRRSFLKCSLDCLYSLYRLVGGLAHSLFSMI